MNKNSAEALVYNKDILASPFVCKAIELGQLVTEKNAAYGDSFARSGRIMKELYPQGVPVEKLDDALAIVRVLDKLFRIATAKDAFGESPWNDVAGYAILSSVRDSE